MSQDFLHPNISAVESQDVPRPGKPSWLQWLYTSFRVPRFSSLACLDTNRVDRSLHTQPTGSTPPSELHRLCANLGTFLRRLLDIVLNPKSFVPVIVDCWLLVQSTWAGRQVGPDFIYPMLGIKKRQSRRLAKLVLDYCRDGQLYSHRATGPSQQGIDPPCVAIPDFSQVSRSVVENSYSAKADLFGIACVLVLLNLIASLAILCGLPSNLSSVGSLWAISFFPMALVCFLAVVVGDGTLSLFRVSRLEAPPECVVLLGQDFTVLLNGNRDVTEAIAEGGVNLELWRDSDPLGIRTGLVEGRLRGLTYHDILGVICEGAVPLVLGLLIVRVVKLGGSSALQLALALVLCGACVMPTLRDWPQSLQRPTYLLIMRIAGPLALASLAFTTLSYGPFLVPWYLFAIHSILISLICLHSGNYPIQSEKLFEALGRPPVRKWEFDTAAAAAAFQCLVICHGIPRPVDAVDLLAFLDVLLPDETEVRRAWKRRVADRITHEEDISFTPTIPTFRDERQQQLLDLLEQAKVGYDIYRNVYARGVSPSSPVDGDGTPPTYAAMLWSAIQRRFSFSA